MPTEPLKANIGIFDSGVGGLSITAEIRALLPEASLLYCCDNLNYPYGPKEETAIIGFVKETVSRLLHQYPLDILVVACNTASTVALPTLRKKIDLPIVGVVPAIKTAAQLTQTNTFGLLATPGTVNRSYTQDLINNFAPDCRVIKVGSSALVDLAEAKVRGTPVSKQNLMDEIAPLFDTNHRIDTVVLGCTHFPLLQPELSECAPWPVKWVDSGEAIANRVKYLLENEVTLQNKSASLEAEMAVFTQLDKDVSLLETHYLATHGFTRVEKI